MSQTPSTEGSSIAIFEESFEPALFRALGDPTRLTLLGRLAMARGPLTVSEVAGCCGVHLSGVSRHLKMLLGAGLVTATRQGREVRYRLRCAALSGALRAAADALDRCAAGCGSTPDDDADDHRQTSTKGIEE